MLRTYKQLTLRRILRRSMLVFAALTLTLTSFAPSAFAAAPQDTYTWQRNIGTAGCPPTPTSPTYLSLPSVAIGNGKIYVTNYTKEVLVFDLSGNSLAKFGSSGSGDGQFGNPQDIAIDASGNIWVADPTYQRIQKFDSNGNFLLKFGSAGVGNGQFSFGNNSTMAFDSAGNIWVVDGNNRRIEKFDSSGNYLSQFSVSAYGGPMGIAIDSAGNVRVVFSGSLYKFSPTGTMLTQYPITNGSSNGQLGDGGLYQVARLSLDASDNMYVTDARNSRIEKFDANGNYLTKFGTSGTGNGQFSTSSILGTALDSSGNIWVSAGNNSPDNIQKFDASGNFLVKITQFTTSTPPDDPTRLCSPHGIARSASGKLYVTDTTRHNVKIYNPDGTIASTFGSQGSGNGELIYPAGIALNSSGDIYVVDAGNNRIEVFNPDGTYKMQFGSTGTGDGEFSNLAYSYYYGVNPITVGADGSVYVADTGTSRIEKFSANGTYQTQFSVTMNGAAVALPMSLTMDADDMLYVTALGLDGSGNYLSAVEKYTNSGTFVSQFGSYGTSDGQFDIFQINIAVDDLGNSYVVDGSHNRVEKFDTNGNYLSQFGTTGSNNDQFNSMRGVVVDSDGNTYIVDAGAQHISVWSAPIPPSAPQNLKQSLASATVARLTWAAPANAGSLNYTYTVQYRIKGSSAWTTVAANLPSSTTTYDLSGLTAGAAYDVQVLAVNSIGSSPVASLSFVMGGLADTGVNMWTYAGIAMIVIGGATAVLWRMRVPRRARSLR